MRWFGPLLAVSLLSACGGSPQPIPQAHADLFAGASAVLTLPAGERHSVILQHWVATQPGAYGPVILVTNVGTTTIMVGSLRCRYTDGSETDKDYRGGAITAEAATLSPGESTHITALFSDAKAVSWIRYEVTGGYVSFDAPTTTPQAREERLIPTIATCAFTGILHPDTSSCVHLTTFA